MISTKKPIYMNLKATNQNMVEVDAAVKFDEIKMSDEGIMYIQESNSIMFTADGIFFVSWWISALNSSNPRNLATEIEDSNQKMLASAELNVAVAVSVSEFSISGNGLIKVKKGDSIRLLNKSDGNFILSRENGFSGVMTITEVDPAGGYLSVRNSGNIDNVRQGGIIKMDTVDFSSNILYSDGTLTIMEEGMYIFAWKVQIDTTNIFGNLNFVFSINRGGIQFLTSGVQGGGGFLIQIAEGLGVLNVAAGDVLALYNMSDSTVDIGTRRGNIPVNLGVFKL